jgi:hypothetical protein
MAPPRLGCKVSVLAAICGAAAAAGTTQWTMEAGGADRKAVWYPKVEVPYTAVDTDKIHEVVVAQISAQQAGVTTTAPVSQRLAL